MSDGRAALAALLAHRRRNGTAGVDAFDAFYQAYVTALLAGMGVLVAASWLGDEPVHVGDAAIARHGAAWLACAASVVVAIGLRSGSRGGPFAVEAPDVRHVLLAPVDRGVALRTPALRQLRFLLGAAAAAGAAGGVLASHRLPGGMLGWIAAGSLYAVATVALAVGTAWCAAGVRLPPAVATAVAAALLGWSALALRGDVPAPAAALGWIGVLPVRDGGWSVVAAFVAGAGVLAVGRRLLGGASVERLGRRSALVGQLRFAATMRDLRTVMVLRRQLTQETPRARPWVQLPGTRALPVVIRRDVRALVRMPAARALRLAGSVATAALAGIGVWKGSNAFAILGGLAGFLAALELLEPLAQELDHPHLLDLAPVPRGDVLAQHLVVPTISLLLCALACAVPLGLLVGGPVAPTLCVLAALAGAPAAVAGAAGSILRDSVPGAVAIDDLAIPPEAVGMRMLFKTVWPLLLAAAGSLPVVVARGAALRGEDPVGAASTVTGLVVAGAVGFAWWVRSRDELRASWSTATDAARTPTAGA